MIHSKPSGALIVDHEGNDVGKTGETIWREVPQHPTYTIVLPGFNKQNIRPTRNQLMDHHRFPEKGYLALAPESPWVGFRFWLNEYRLEVGLFGGAMLLFGVAAWPKYQRHRQRSARAALLENFRTGSASDASLLMRVLDGY